MRLEVVETETRDGDVRQKTVQVYPNPYICPYCQSKYRVYSSVANAATAIWQHCSTCAELKVKDAGPTMPAFTMKIFDSISIMEAKMTEKGGFDFEPSFDEWVKDANQVTRWGTLIIRNNVDVPSENI